MTELKKKTIKTKVCPKCKKELPSTNEYFYKNKACKNGLSKQCKKCIYEYNKQIRLKRQQEHKERVKQWKKNLDNHIENKTKKQKCKKEYERKKMSINQETNQGESKNTEYKQIIFSEILSKHLNICSCIFRKNKNEYWCDSKYYYFDTNSGCGHDSHGGKGSPFIFIDTATKINIDYKAFFIDKNKNNTESLSKKINFYKTNNKNEHEISCSCGDNEKILFQYSDTCLSGCNDKKYGLIYCDPNGFNDLPFDSLKYISSIYNYRNIDMLLHVSATSIKRTAGAKKKKGQEYTTLLNELRKINKKYWLIREPFSAWHWTMIIGTNWDSFPKFKQLGFHDIKSPKGQITFDRLNLTNKQFKEKYPGFNYQSTLIDKIQKIKLKKSKFHTKKKQMTFKFNN